MSNNNGNGNQFDEPDHIRDEFNSANQIENLTDYEPDLNQEFDGGETEFEFEIPPELEGVIDGGAIRNIRSTGVTRTSIQITMSSDLRGQWYNFVETLTGNKISPGRTSASAPLVTIGMRLLMALVAEFEVRDTINDLQELLGIDGYKKLNRMTHKFLEDVSQILD